MTREDLAKDILLAYIRSQDRTVVEIPFADLAADAVDQADALLEALGAKEAQASWLSKEMRTPAKGFPVIKTVEPGVSVVVRAKGEPTLNAWDGRFGVVVEKFNSAGLWIVNIGEDRKLVAPTDNLEVR